MGRFRRYAEYLTARYGRKTYRVGVDAGFSCPGRDAGRPCRFCFEDGSRAPYLGAADDLASQVQTGIAFLRRRYKAERFLLYFQAFSSTYAPVAQLRSLYRAGLAAGEFSGMVVSTRPDCVDAETAELLASFASAGLDVWVELGLQSAHDQALERVDRGHTVSQFVSAYHELKSRGILVGVHLMAGLPGESLADFLDSVRFVARLRPDGIKFHNLVVVARTPLYGELRAGAIAPFGLQRYIRYVAAAIQELPPETVVLRLGFDPPRGIPHVPASRGKRDLYDAVEAELERCGGRQSSRWTSGPQ
jgi:uncharacterized protein